MEEIKKAAGCCNIPDGHNKNTTCGKHTTGGAEKSRIFFDFSDDLENIRNKTEQLESAAFALSVALEFGRPESDAYAGMVGLMLDTLHEIEQQTEALSKKALQTEV